MEERRRAPRADVLTGLATATFPDGSMPEPIDVVRVAANVFSAGQETTVRLLGSALQLIAEHPDMQERLRQDHARIPEFVEECLRYESPVKGDFRLARRPVTVGGVDVPAGTTVMVLNGAAGRDPRRFENPEAFVMDRPNAKEHLAFGRGPHACPGGPLARAETRISIERLLDRMENIHISDTAARAGRRGDTSTTSPPTIHPARPDPSSPRVHAGDLNQRRARGMHEGRIAIVTGGGSGIGLAISRRLAADGHAVAVLDISAEAAAEAAAAINAQGGHALGYPADVADRGQVVAAVESVRAQLGPAGILVNQRRHGNFDVLPLSRHHARSLGADHSGVNLTGAFNCCQAVVPDMIEAGWGRIVNISSSSTHSGQALLSPYVASKSGLNGLTKSLALELGSRGITVQRH